jgi:hypothetical protein
MGITSDQDILLDNDKYSGIWPYSTEAATRPNKEHHDSLEFPFPRLTLAIRAENDRNEGYDPPNSREKVPVPAEVGNWL